MKNSNNHNAEQKYKNHNNHNIAQECISYKKQSKKQT